MLVKSIDKVNENKLQEAIAYIISHGHDTAYPLEIVKILLAIYPNHNTVLASLLSTILSSTDSSIISLCLQEIADQYGIEITNIIEGILKLSTINYLPYNITQAQKFFDSLLSMPQEVAVGVLFIKLSHLLHNISIFAVNSSQEKYTIFALEIMELYVPLMARMGREDVKIELQEICLTILQPDTREYILSHLHTVCGKGGKDIKDLINQIINSLCNSLKAEGIHAKILGRIKTPYSIWLKMLQNNINIGQLYDILAFRIIVDNIEQCYQTLAVIHTHYQIVQGHFQDYIRKPKPNGYQSLHTIVIGPTSKKIEIQIRTRTMNDVAQHGKAAHWQYKKKSVLFKDTINIYHSLYQTAYLPLMNILKIQTRDREIKQRMLRIYKFELYKDLGTVRNLTSCISFNDNTTNILQNSHNINLTLLEPNVKSSCNHGLFSLSDISAGLSLDNMFPQVTYQLIIYQFKTLDSDRNLLLDASSITTYIPNESDVIYDPPLSVKCTTKTEVYEFTEQISKPLWNTEPLIRNVQYHLITIPLNNTTTRGNSDYSSIISLAVAQYLNTDLPILLSNDEELDTLPILNNNLLDNTNINPLCDNGLSRVTKAVQHKNNEEVKDLLKNPEFNPNEGGTFIPASRTFNNIWPEFLLAVYLGDEEIIQAFLNHPKINVTQHNQNLETALIIAALASNIEAFQLLVDYFKANWQHIFQNNIEQFQEYVNWQESNYHSALYYATDNYLTGATDNPAIIQALLEWKDNQQQHLISIQEQQLFTVLVLQALGLISYTPEVEENENYDKYGITASYGENPDNLYKVLEKFLTLRGIIDHISLTSTIENNFKIHFASLLDINEPDDHGNTLLIIAILKEDINTVKCLLQFPEIDINKTTSIPTALGMHDNNPPFLFAVSIGNVEIIQEFLSHPQTDITQTNQDHETALIIAAQTVNVETFILLARHFKAHWQDIFDNNIEKFREYINWHDNNYASALSYATDHYLMDVHDDPAIIQELIEWKDPQHSPLVSIPEQKKFWARFSDLDEGYTSMDNPESQEEKISQGEKVSCLHKLAEQWGVLRDDDIPKTANQITVQDLMDIERAAKEVAEFYLRELWREEERIKQIGDDDYAAWG